MSFLGKCGEIAGKAVTGAVKDLQKKQERIERYKERYCDYSDEELKRKLQNSSGEAKWACIQLLKERGYGD